MSSDLPTLPLNTDLGLLILRAWVGVVGFLHGSQKLFGWFGGDGIKGFAETLSRLHVPAPVPSAVMAGLAELGCGLLIALGIFPRLAAIPFAFTMLVALGTAHKWQLFGKGGGEYAVTLAVLALALILIGPGKWTVMKLAK